MISSSVNADTTTAAGYDLMFIQPDSENSTFCTHQPSWIIFSVIGSGVTGNAVKEA